MLMLVDCANANVGSLFLTIDCEGFCALLHQLEFYCFFQPVISPIFICSLVVVNVVISYICKLRCKMILLLTVKRRLNVSQCCVKRGAFFFT